MTHRVEISARRLALAARDRSGVLDECPTPKKVRYLTRGEARHAARQQPKRKNLHPYKCRCRYFHLGRLRPATRAGESEVRR